MEKGEARDGFDKVRIVRIGITGVCLCSFDWLDNERNYVAVTVAR